MQTLDFHQKRYRPGYTLSELLIALLILGIVAVFGLSKVLAIQQNQQRNALMKETIGMLSQIQRQGTLTGELNAANFTDYFLNKVNASKICPNDSSTEGCWDIAIQGETPLLGETYQPGFILANGVRVTGVDPGVTGLPDPNLMHTGILIDWNGLSPPNIIGRDQLEMVCCYGTSSCVGEGGGPAGSFTVFADLAYVSPENIELYAEIFR